MTKKILIIEDNLAQSQMIDFFFKNNGFETIVCESAEDGLLNLEQYRDDIYLITLDINLPGISGLHLLPKIKNNPNYNHIPIVVISALGQENNINKALELGVDDYLVKPVSLKSLENVIVKYLK